jgi:hypothetical protein
LGSAIFAEDGRRVVALSKGLRGEVLQLGGDGLLLALAQGVEEASELARRCAEQLRGRAWAGDNDLADQLDAALGNRPSPMLRPLPIDVEELASILEGDTVHGGGRIDLRTGEFWPQAAVDYAQEEDREDPDDEDPHRWLPVRCEGSIEGISDRDRADRLSIVISGPGGLPPLQDILERWPGELEAGTRSQTSASEAAPEPGSPPRGTRLACRGVP